MYTFEDIKKVEKDIIRHLIYVFAATLLFVAVLVAACRNWGTSIDPIRLPIWPVYIVGAVYSIYLVFEISFYLAKLFRYRSYVYNILNGLERILKGVIIKVDKNISYDRDLEFFSIDVEKEDGLTRSLRFDAIKNIDILKTNEPVELKVFGNYIKEVVS